MYIPVARRAMRTEPHVVDWLELLGTWTLVALVATGVWFEWKADQREK